MGEAVGGGVQPGFEDFPQSQVDVVDIVAGMNRGMRAYVLVVAEGMAETRTGWVARKRFVNRGYAHGYALRVARWLLAMGLIDQRWARYGRIVRLTPLGLLVAGALPAMAIGKTPISEVRAKGTTRKRPRPRPGHGLSNLEI